MIGIKLKWRLSVPKCCFKLHDLGKSEIASKTADDLFMRILYCARNLRTSQMSLHVIHRVRALRTKFSQIKRWWAL